MTLTRSNPLHVKARTCLPHYFVWLFCVALLAWSHAAFAARDMDVPELPTEGSEAWLVTFGPGDIYWERFGHNAIWLREPAAGLDHTFNFGYFDFDQENFFLRFMRGRMLYFSVAQPAAREFAFYQQADRSIRLQKIRLTPLQYQNLRDYLLTEIMPENRDYRYDYYLNNCSTRIRDALDIALDGALSARTKVSPAELNFRDQTRRLTQMQFWYYLGLELGLGLPVDRAVTRWDEMFVPMVVADEMAAMSSASSFDGSPLVEVDQLLFQSAAPTPAVAPATIWFRYLLLGLLVVGIAWLSGRFMPPVWVVGLCHSWVLVSVTGGLVLAALWLLTDHEVTRPNANLLLLNPLFLLALWPALRRIGALIMLGGVVAGLVLLILPVHQNNLDVIALLAPVNLAVAVVYLKMARGASKL
jgi:hypothetical protein